MSEQEIHRIAAETASAARVAELEGALLEARSGLVAFAYEACADTIAKVDAALAHTIPDADDAGGVK